MDLGGRWTFHSIVSLDIHTVKFQPLRGGTYIPLPKFIASKKVLINMKFKSEKRRNEDVQCFKLCIARALNPVKDHPERITRQLEKQAETLNFDGISFPMKLKVIKKFELKDIKKFEQQNPQISVNVLGYEGKTIFSLRMSEMAERGHGVNLLLLENKHFVLINDLSRLLSHQISNHKGKRFFWLRCLNSFTKKDVLDKHKESCEKHDCVKLRMPEKGSIVERKNHKHSIPVPIVVYADFECLTKPIESCKPNSEHSYTEQYQKHEPSGFCFNIVCDGKKQKTVLYTKKSANENIGKIFCKNLKNEIDKVCTSEAKPMIINEEDKVNFETSTNCWICRKDFEEGEVRVRDGCHFTGKYRGAAHQKCNILFSKPHFVPVFFHNFSGYDAHMFVKNLNS